MVTTGILPPTRKIPMVEAGIEPGTSWFVARSLDHETGHVPSWTENFKASVLRKDARVKQRKWNNGRRYTELHSIKDRGDITYLINRRIRYRENVTKWIIKELPFLLFPTCYFLRNNEKYSQRTFILFIPCIADWITKAITWRMC